MNKSFWISVLTAALFAVFIPVKGMTYDVYAREKGNEKVKKVSYVEIEVPVFKGELTDEKIKIRSYSTNPSIPYVGIKEYYDCIMKESLDDEDKTMSVEKNGNIYILKNAHGQATIDTRSGQMSSDDMNAFTNIMSLTQKGVSNCYVDGVPYVRVKDTKVTGGRSVTFDFAKYHIRFFADEKDVYFPVSTLSDIFTDMVYHYSVCNGKTFYFNCVDASNNENMENIDPDYAFPIMDLLDKDLNRPEDMTEYAYNELLFSIDYFYGLPGKAVLNDEIGEKGLEQALLDYGAEGEKTIELLKSRNLAEYFCGLEKLQLFVGDGGHTGVDYIFLGNAKPETLKEKMDKINKELEPEYENIQKEYDEIMDFWGYHQGRKKLRDDIYKGEKYIKEGDTAVYVLDSFLGFDIDKWNKYYLDDGPMPSILTMRDDDILLIEECMKDAENDPKIKNFVIDLSCNTGGSLDEVAMLNCMITGKREITVTMENSLSGQRMTETYEADLNHDKIFDENDEREPYDLNFAVITSPSSFSCGNIFPSVMKDEGYMILGDRSGGGACAVMVPTTGEGFTYRLSNYKGRFVNALGENIDEGVEVDVNLIPLRSNGKQKFITVHDIKDSSGKKRDKRIPDYSEFYNIKRLSKEINKFYR